MKIKSELSFRCRDGTWDRGIISEEFKMYHIDKYLEKGIDTAIDIGAHIGGTTVLLAKSGVKVWAVEPCNGNFELLDENVRRNKLDNVVLYNKAVGAEAGKRTLYVERVNTGLCSFYGKGNDTQEVEIITLDDILKEMETCDLLKMDCEGSEYEILMNQKDFSKIKNIVAELHFDKERELEIINKLKNHYHVETNKRLSNGDWLIYCT